MKPILDAQVDNRLGDSITYKIDGVPVELDSSSILPAFLTFIGDDGGFDGLSPLQSRWRLKIRKSLLPVRPAAKHVITAAKLDGPYRPGANVPADGGDYWLVDLQKAPA